MATENVPSDFRSRWFAYLWADGAPLAGSRKRFPGRRSIRLFLLSGLVIAALILPLACATSITPPPRPADPVLVYLIDHGRTSSLVLPAADGGLIRYAYGDWEWYALMHTGVRSGLRALFWPSQAALGRHHYAGPQEPERVREIFAGWSASIDPIAVGREPASRLARALDERYRAHLDTLHVNTAYELEFVRDAEPYHCFHNSNRAVADWLRQAGCTVRGPAILSRWKVRQPPEKSEVRSQESEERSRRTGASALPGWAAPGRGGLLFIPWPWEAARFFQ